MAEILISGDKLEKSFGGRQLFNGVSLGLKSDDRVGLIGPNGAGKSTLLKIMAKKLEADSGNVIWRKNLKVGHLEQEPIFKPEDTIASAFSPKASHDQIAYWLSRLDLNQFGEDFLVSGLSGGWKRRLSLATQLVFEPDVLLLDEPTNHLDVHGVIWLEEFLSELQCSLLMVTHDRLFLQRTTNVIWDLEPRLTPPLRVYLGGYLSYLEGKELEMEIQKNREDKVKNTVRREKEWLARGAKARQTKQKARIESALALIDEAADLKQRNTNNKLKLNFADLERSPKKLIEAEDVSKSYGERKVIDNFSCLMTPQSRIALIGDNGAGKTTLIKLLLGKLAPDSGKIKQADGTESIVLEQERSDLDLKKSVLENMLPSGGDFVSDKGQFVHVRSYLERFKFSRLQMDLKVEKLSGGERARLRLAQLLTHNAQILVLDEPTNDLDIETLESLSNAIQDFLGAVIIVSHDRFFIDQVATEIWSLENGKVERFADYFQWEQADQAKKKIETQVVQGKSQSSGNNESKDSKLTNKEKYELEKMESVILGLETQFEEVKALLATENEPKKLSELYIKSSKLETEIHNLYDRWAYLAAKG